MLVRLTIRDFVLVRELELGLAPGFGVLTGETGAGKSILLDALDLLLGGRASAEVIRQGAERAEVTLECTLPPAAEARAWLEAHGIEVEGDTLLLRRNIERSGRSRAWIEAVPVPATALREFGAWIADIHGQHAHHALLESAVQRRMLDRLAGAEALAEDVRQRFAAWESARERLARARERQESVGEERERLLWQLQEWERLALRPGEWDEVQQEHRRLAHAAQLLQQVAQAAALLSEDEPSAQALLGQAERALAGSLEFDAKLAEAVQLVSEARIGVQEAAASLRRYLDAFELDPARLAELERRLAAIDEFARRYRVPPEELFALAGRWRERLAALEESADLGRLEAEVRAAESAYFESARALSERRRETAEWLSAEVSAAMQELAMKGGRFAAALVAAEPAATGLERVEFRVAANPSQPLAPLARVASGGELSRIGLAIQVIASRASDTPTLIFDEVDVGIGGAVAEIVGRSLWQLGRDRQVLAVTHLPQVAAWADWQLRVWKEEEGGAVRTRVEALDAAARVEEIARMLGGLEITDTTREHARELLGRRGMGQVELPRSG
ncbi:DNA repair protein RecN [Tepidiphilus margaritifer]|uniref:DNA repair protein RecN n=1 Tax=Tepidiphilus margaritifer TaxID=203471 RepID=UPI0004285F95|nr:DNA repair protein RecN [Tepidiphilus margaritifer]